jgi:hypothetical protein
MATLAMVVFDHPQYRAQWPRFDMRVGPFRCGCVDRERRQAGLLRSPTTASLLTRPTRG